MTSINRDWWKKITEPNFDSSMKWLLFLEIDEKKINDSNFEYFNKIYNFYTNNIKLGQNDLVNTEK